MTVRIVHVATTNAAVLDRVAEDAFDETIDRDRLAAYLADPRHAMLVAIVEGVAVGQIRGNVHLQPDRAPDLYIDNLGVDPSHQRQGLASRLIKALIAWGKAQGCTYVWVATEPDNAEGIGFYKSLGFERRGLEWFAAELDDDA